ncbi:hypothetical protein D3C74_394100 [compost metagenome]
MPATSILRPERWLGSLSVNHATRNAAMPIGTLIQKAQRQPGPSVNQPPRSGPITAAMPNRAPMGPMYFPRSLAGTMSAMMACDRIMRPPPPRPWTARHATSSGNVWAKPAPADAMVNRPIATRNGQRRPHRSPNLP